MVISIIAHAVSLPVLLVLAVPIYFAATVLYNLYVSPLRKFPGPKLAAATWWYEFYYDAVQGGKYIYKIREMHEKYGPVVRITPREIHIIDPDFLPTVFSSVGGKRNKFERYTHIFGGSEAAIATVDHDMHRMRRGPVGRFFSKESVRRVEPIIHYHLEGLFRRIEEFKRNGSPLSLVLAFSAFTSEIITEYAFAKPYGYLDLPDFNKVFFDMMISVHGIAPVARQFKYIIPLMESLPPSLVKRVDPGMNTFFMFQEEMRNRIRDVKNGSEYYKQLSHRTVFHEILHSSLPEREKTVERLWQDAQVITVAGTETTAWTLSVITFYLLSDPGTLKKLKEELDQAMPDPVKIPSWNTLEKLPYLTAVIQEGLRLSYGVSARQQRICPDEVITYDDGKVEWRIPAGTPIATSTPLIHLNPEIFPSPHDFNPERWIENPRLEKYLWSFSRGSRQCLGINLAYAEMYVCLATLFRRYGTAEIPGPRGTMKLFDTTIKDVEFKYDMFVPFPEKGSKGIRAVFE